MKKFEIEIGGKRRELKFSTFAIMRMEEEIDETVLEKEFFTEPSYRKMVTLIWGGLLETIPKVSLELVARWIDEATKTDKKAFGEFYKKAADAYFDHQGIVADEEEGEEKKDVSANG